VDYDDEPIITHVHLAEGHAAGTQVKSEDVVVEGNAEA
jgi:hypothetical protein